MKTDILAMYTYLCRKQNLLTLVIHVFFLLSVVRAGGHHINGHISGYQGNQAFLAMIYGGNQYAVDTADVTGGAFEFVSMYHLQSGVYAIILPPSHSFLILVDQNNPEIRLSGDISDLNNTLRFDNSIDNAEFYAYLKFFDEKRAYLDKLKEEYDSNADKNDKAELLSKMQQLKKDIGAYQLDLVMRVPGTLTAALVKCELPVDIPVFNGSPDEINLRKYIFQRTHFFDNIDLTDERLIRAPKNVLVDRVEYFLDYVIPQQPDSIISAVDEILQKTWKSQPSYRFFLTHLFNKYRTAKTIGMDAVYVHIAESYIASGKAPWIDEEEKIKVLAAVKRISPTLIGKKAPDFVVQSENGSDISLYSVEAPYTVLFFWAPNCPHCHQSIPVLNKFYDTHKDKGVQVFAVCTKLNEHEKDCWEYLDNNNLYRWINASDKSGNSMIHKQYNITSTPKIYVLSQDKTIVAKDLGVEHLEEVMKRLHEKSINISSMSQPE